MTYIGQAPVYVLRFLLDVIFFLNCLITYSKRITLRAAVISSRALRIDFYNLHVIQYHISFVFFDILGHKRLILI